MSKVEKRTFINGEYIQINLPGLVLFYGKINTIIETEPSSLMLTLKRFYRWAEFQRELKINQPIEWQYSDKIRIRITLDDIRIVNISYRAYTEQQIIADIKFAY